MKLLFPLAAISLGLSPVIATADTAHPLPLTYATFEAAVPHIDLDTCPPALKADTVFCRATLANDAIHVFAFSYDGDNPMTGFATLPAETLSALTN